MLDSTPPPSCTSLVWILPHSADDLCIFTCGTNRLSRVISIFWRDTLSVLATRGRAQVSVAAATTDWPKRFRDMRYADQDDHGAAD